MKVMASLHLSATQSLKVVVLYKKLRLPISISLKVVILCNLLIIKIGTHVEHYACLGCLTMRIS
jgi:hypothetical protein